MAVDIKSLQAKIEELEGWLERKKTERAQLEGKVEGLKDQLKKQFKISSVKEAEIELTKLDKELKHLADEEAEVVKELEKVIG